MVLPGNHDGNLLIAKAYDLAKASSSAEMSMT